MGMSSEQRAGSGWISSQLYLDGMGHTTLSLNQVSVFLEKNQTYLQTKMLNLSKENLSVLSKQDWPPAESEKNSHSLNISNGLMDFPGVSSKESACQPGDMGLIPELERSPGKGNDNPFQYSCLENPMHREVWWATIHGVTKESNITQRLNNSNNGLITFSFFVSDV